MSLAVRGVAGKGGLQVYPLGGCWPGGAEDGLTRSGEPSEVGYRGACLTFFVLNWNQGAKIREADHLGHWD